MFATLIRTLIVYIILFIGMRVTGKRQIGELQLTELITALLLSELAAMPITDLSIPLLYSVFPTVLIVCLEVAISCLANKIPFFSTALEGKPTMVICRGELIQDALEKSRMGIDELLGELRQKDITDISDVEYAILEQNGKLSVILKECKRQLTVEDVKMGVPQKGLAHPLILGGSICPYNLNLTGKDEKWLRKVIGERKTEDILLLTLDDGGSVNIILKDGVNEK